MLYKRYKYITYIMELMVNRAEAGLGRSSLHLVYAYSLYRAFLVLIYVILNYYN